MIIEDTESLQVWLTTYLKPLCDAEPAALARYILALIKKDNSETELRRNMEDQLDVFLEKEAKPFVDKLCEVLNTKEYITAKVSSSSSETVQSNESVSDNKDAKGKEDRNTNSENRSKNDRPFCHRPARRSPPLRRYSRDNWDRRRARNTLRGRNRSFSPRNRSRTPPRYRRTLNFNRSRSRSPITRGRERTISPKCRSPLAKNSFTDSSKTDSPLTNKETVEKTPLVQSVIVIPRGNDHSPENSLRQSSPTSVNKHKRCRDFDEKGLCMRGELCPYDHGKDPVVLEDIVVPGMVSGGGYGVSGGDMMSSTPPLARPTIMGRYCQDGPSHEFPIGWNPGHHPGFRPRVGHLGLDPLAARNSRGGLLRPMGSYFGPGGQRQFITVLGGGGIPHAPGILRMRGGMPPMSLHPNIRGLRGGHRGCRGGFDYSRLGSKPSPHHHQYYHPQKSHNNCSLEVRKIPRDQNTIMDLNSHFIRFGKITNIQINFDGDPEAALVTFSSPAETQLAYRSTEAVLNNRFIRVFWHTKEKDNNEGETESASSGNTSNQSRIPVVERLGTQSQDHVPMTLEKEPLSENSPATAASDNVALSNKAMKTLQHDKVQAVESTKRNQEVLQAAQVTLKNLQEQRKVEMLKMSNDLRKRQQIMMDEQIAQQKKLITKLESGSLNPKERQETLKVIKMLQDKVTKLQKDLDDSTPTKALHPQNHRVIVDNKLVDEEQKVVADIIGGSGDT